MPGAWPRPGETRHAALARAVRLIPDGDVPSFPRTLDLWMLTISGKQRSLDEYAALLAATGFKFTRAIDTPDGDTIVEGTV